MKVANLTAPGPWHSKGKKEMAVIEPSKNVPLTLSSLTHRTRLKKNPVYLLDYSQPGFYKITIKYISYVLFIEDFSPLFSSKDFYKYKAKC